jgi:MFS family permease
VPGLWRIVATLLVAQTYAGIAVNCSGVYGPVVTRDLGIAPQFLGIHVGLVAVLGVLAGFVLNGAVVRYGAVRTLQVSLAGSASGFLLAASGEPLLVIGSAIVVGVAMGLGMPASAQLLATATPPGRLGLVFSIKQSGVPLAIGICGLLIPALLLVMHWRSSLLVLAAGVLPVIALLQPLRVPLDGARRPDAPLRGGGFLEPVRRVLAQRDLKTLSIAVLLLAAVQGALISYTVSYLNLELGYSLVLAGAALTSGQVATVAARLFYGWLMDRIGDPLVVIAWLALGAAAAATVVALAQPGWPAPVVFVVVILFSMTGGGWMGIYQAGLVRYADPAAIPASVVGTQAFLFLGGIAGPLVFALLSGLAGSYASSFALFGTLALAAGAWIFVRGSGAPRPALRPQR